MCGLWDDSRLRAGVYAGWSVCRAWRDAMTQDPGAVAEALLSHKASSLASALYTVVKHGHVGVVLALLAADGAHVDMACTSCGASPLWLASMYGHVDLVRALLSAGALVNLTTTDKSTSPLLMASV